MAPKKSAPKKSATTPPEPTHFLNVDLEIGSRGKLDVLAAELSSRLFELYRGKVGQLDRAHYEISAMTPTADVTIRALVRILKKLTPAARRVWNSARVRDFNIGIQAGATPRSAELAIEPKTLQQITALGGRIVITIYAAELTTAAARSPGRG
jgi:hypothetical protein